MLVRLALALCPLLFSCAAPRSGDALGVVVPEQVGLSSERLARLDAAVEGLLDEGALAGAVVLLARGGAVAHFEAYGDLDAESETPMPRDALFRLCSMSKAVTSVAAMILYEEGRFLLDDPVARFLPEFADARVLAEAGEDGAPAFEPARQPITVRHLLTHTAGIAYRFTGTPVSELYAAAGVSDGLAEADVDLAENVRRIAGAPLLHQPGERFTYGLSTDVLGRLVEVLAGEPLGDFLERRLFAPLGMHDTGFAVSAAERTRLATVYRTDRGALEPLAEGPTTAGLLVFSPSYPYAAGPRNESGGAGLVSSARDYARFCQMLLGGGELDGARVLAPKTVELMSADHLAALDPDPGFAFGLGFGLASDPGLSGESTSAGTLSWSGFYTTRFWIDPEEDFLGVILTQTYPFNSGRALDRLQALAYQAICGPPAD